MLVYSHITCYSPSCSNPGTSAKEKPVLIVDVLTQGWVYDCLSLVPLRLMPRGRVCRRIPLTIDSDSNREVNSHCTSWCESHNISHREPQCPDLCPWTTCRWAALLTSTHSCKNSHLALHQTPYMRLSPYTRHMRQYAREL